MPGPGRERLGREAPRAGARVPAAGDAARAEAAGLPGAPPGSAAGAGPVAGGVPVWARVWALRRLDWWKRFPHSTQTKSPWRACVRSVPGRRQGRGREENIISLSNGVMGHDQQPSPRPCRQRVHAGRRGDVNHGT